MPSNTPTNGDDTFSYGPSTGFVSLDGLGGSDTLNIDYSSASAGDYAQYDGASGLVDGNAPFLTYGVNFQSIEAVNFNFGGGADTFSVSGAGSHATVDGGAGTDTFHGQFNTATAVIYADFSTAGSHAISGTNTILVNFENYDIATGAGNDTLVGGGGSDTLNGGAGHNLLEGGGGGDEFDSVNGIDTIVGGDGDDIWYANYSGTTEGLAFAQGTDSGAFAISGFSGGGVASVSGVEHVAITGGYGADTVSLHTGSGFVSASASFFLNGGGGDVLDVDYSAVTTGQTGSIGSPQSAPLLRTEIASNDASADGVLGDGFDTLRLKLGSGDDSFRLYGSGLHATLDGGGGQDTFYGDFHDATGAVSIDITNTADQAISGTRTHIAHFETLGAVGGAGNDTLIGGGGDDTLTGGWGDNTLYGGGGADLLSSAGADVVWGGAGEDTWSGDYSTFSDNLAFTQQATPGDYLVSGLPGGASTVISGVEAIGSFTGGEGADTISLHHGVGSVSIDGGDGLDLLRVDDSAVTTAVSGSFFGSTGYLSSGVDQLNATNIESFDIALGLGNDSFSVSLPSGPITVDGGAGDDTLSLLFASGSISGGAGDDTISASAGDALTLVGGAGDDVVQVSASSWTVTLGFGVDHLFASLPITTSDTASDFIVTDFAAGAGGDVFQPPIFSSSAADNPFADGHLRLLQFGSDVLLQADADGGGDQYISLLTFQNSTASAFTAYNFAGYAPDPNASVTLTGGAGADVFHGAGDADKLNGGPGAGADALYGGGGGDVLFGELGNDTLDGGAGGDLMNGGAGNDLYHVDDVADRVIEAPGGGYDTVRTTLSTYVLPANVEAVAYVGYDAFNGRGGGGSDELTAYSSNSATLHGGGGDDLLAGGYGADSLYGDAGDDLVYGGYGDDYVRSLTGEGQDTIYGGDGTDLLTIERTDATQALTVDLSLTDLQALGEGSLFQSIEQIRVAGGLGNDSFIGGDLDDVLKGNGGADALVGGGGNDVLQGGAGHDSLTGGPGADTFRFDGPVAGSDDTVTDFASGTDHVALSKAGFGIASLAEFDIVSASSGAFEHKATLVVDTVNHTLSWDADGNGAGAAVLLAHGAFTTAAGDYTLF